MTGNTAPISLIRIARSLIMSQPLHGAHTNFLTPKIWSLGRNILFAKAPHSPQKFSSSVPVETYTFSISTYATLTVTIKAYADEFIGVVGIIF